MRIPSYVPRLSTTPAPEAEAGQLPPPVGPRPQGGPIDTFEAAPVREQVTFLPPRARFDGESVSRPEGDDPDGPGRVGGTTSTLSPWQSFTLRGVEVRPNGALPAAIEEARRILESMVTRPDIADRLREHRVTMVIVPANTRLTDLPEFAHLRGKTTADGRPFEKIRGVATYGRDGRYYVGVPEENLGSLPQDRYGGAGNYNVGVHEMGHAILERGVTGIEKFFERLHFNSGAQRTAFVTGYASTNHHEYMAESTGAYFRRNAYAGERNSPEWLQRSDPVMYSLLYRIYGPPPQAKS